MKARRSSILYGTMLLTCTNIFSQLLGFFYRIVLSRLIGAEVMGLYQLVMPVYSVVMSIVSVGLTMAVSNLASEYQALDNWVAARQVLGRCLCILVTLFLPIAVIVVIFYDPISVSFLGDARTQLGLILLLPCILLTGVENLCKHFFYGTGNVRPPAFIELAEQVVRIVAVLGLLLVFLPQNPEKTVGLIVTGMIVSEIFSACTLVTLFRRRMAAPRYQSGRLIPRGQLYRRIAGIALPVGGTALLGNLMGTVNAVLIPKQLVYAGADVSEAMSAFGVLCGMTLPMLFLPTAFIGAINLVLVPKFAESAALGQKELITNRVCKAMLATSVLILPAMAFMIVLGPTIGEALFQDARVGAFIAPLAVGVVFSCYQSILGGVLNGVGRQQVAAVNALLSGALQLACTFFLMRLPGVGLRGYVIGFVASSILGALLNWWWVHRVTSVKMAFFQWGLAPTLAAVLMGLCVHLLFPVLLRSGMGGIPAVLGCIAFGCILYLVTLLVQGVSPLKLFRNK
ncbi:MAG: oligosaccharide flippase family protein [Oscillospiraceae bacterium]|nr:oligosaccharide flippase family protein [Oscillospiraceae bacterium]